MGIWDSLRRFSTRGTSTRDNSTKKRQGASKMRLKERGLRLEKFEERMLLSITTPGLDETYFEDGAGRGYYVDPSPVAMTPPAEEYSDVAGQAWYPFADTFSLHSNPGASKVIYLDFDGHTTTDTAWNTLWGMDTIVTPAYDFDGDVTTFSTAEMQLIQDSFDLVSEDFLPFDVDVTTEDPGVEALRNTGGGDTEWGIRVVIGPDQADTGAGGIAYLTSFNWDSDTPCWVFNTSFKGLAEAVTHETGHTLGLRHDGDSTQEYYPGYGSGATGWAPIMGVGYDQELVQWSQGEYPDANNQEDDLNIIATQNGFGYRADDHGSTIGTPEPMIVTDDDISQSGIIEANTDVDYFEFATYSGPVSLDIDPFYLSPNLDILATLYDESGTAIATSNPVDRLDAGFNLTLDAGTYYLSVDGTGKPVTTDPGYSDYGSLGYYSISGSIISIPPTPPELVLVIPQEGGFVDRGDTLYIAPRELVLRFNEGQQFIDESASPAKDPNGWLSGGRSGIQVTRSVNGVWGDGDDEIIDIGWIGIGDRPNDVVLRFAEALPDNDYRISIIGSDGYVGPDGQPVEPLRNTDNVTFRAGEPVVDEHFDFELDLGAQVTAVVQQPVVTTSATIEAKDADEIDDGITFTVGDGKDRVVFEFDNPGAANYVLGRQTTGSVLISINGTDDANRVAREIAAAIEDQTPSYGGDLDLAVAYSTGNPELTVSGQRVMVYGQELPITITEVREQLEDTIEVYFNDDDLAMFTDDDATGNAFDLRPEFFQLIVTNDTATLDDDLTYDPADGSIPVRKLQPVEIRYDADLDMAVLRFDKPLSDYGTGAFRLRIGDEYKAVETVSLQPAVEVTEGSFTQNGQSTFVVSPGWETVDGTAFRISDGQFDATVEMDLQAVVLSVDSVPASGTILTLDNGGGAVDISLTITQATQNLVAQEIAAQLSTLGYNAIQDPVDPTRVLIVNALSATPENATMSVSSADYSLLEPMDLSTLVDGEWIEVNGDRYELELPGGDGLQNDPAATNWVTVTGTGAGGSLARGDVVRALAGALVANSVPAIAVVDTGQNEDTRLFILDATSVSAAVPQVTLDDSVYSIKTPSVTNDVDDGEWVEVNDGTRVLRFEFDRGDGSVSPGSIMVPVVPISGNDILIPLETAMIANGVAANLVTSGTPRLIVTGEIHVQAGGVDSDMIVERGVAIDVPNTLGDESDGEYVELFDEITNDWIRFELDSDGIRLSASSILVDIVGNASLPTPITDADALENEINTRGFSTILSGDRVFVFSSPTLTLTDARGGDVGASHLTIEDPGVDSGQADGVVHYHAGMTENQLAQLVADEMDFQIGDKGLYLDVGIQTPTVGVLSPTDAGDSFHTSNELHNFGNLSGPQSVIVSGAIDAQLLLLEWPGAVDEPGHRDLPIHEGTLIEDHFLTGGSSPDSGASGIPTASFYFPSVYGGDPATGLPLLNQITEAQKERTREIFSLYSEYLGISFVESATSGLAIVTGDLRVFDGMLSEPGGVGGVAGGGMAVMDQAESWGTSEFGGSWFEVAMHEIGHLLGYGHAYDLIAGAIMGTAEETTSTSTGDALYPGEHDIVHGQHMYRPDSIDVDLYRFDLQEQGTLSAEVLAERMNDSSLLDSVLTIYREVTVKDEDGNDKTTYELVARNDDYYSEDSLVELYLQPGTYYAGVSASGNTEYDSNIENTGVGGTSQGEYKLRLTFAPDGVDPDDPDTFRGDGTEYLVDVDGTSTKFDGDGDGVPGGAYNFWFNVQEETVFVDKASTSTTEDGSLANPYKTIDKAFALKGDSGAIVRVLGNNYYNDDPNDLSTYDDNVPYEIGENPETFRALDDGRYLQVPQGVTLVIDAGSLFKLSEANVDVGSAAESVDRSGGALQVLGTPKNSVIFTSFRDADIGVDIDPSNKVPEKGDWGGLVFRNELDYDFIEAYDPASGLDPREVLETQGIFLNYVNHADIRYGGGAVEVDGLKSVYAPIHMIEARPTVTFNRITRSADAALSADPNSFAETQFQSWDAFAPFTTRYDRVGPEIRGNYIVENSTNGIFVRISTAAGSAIKELEVSGRFDDWDVVHVIPENLFINGTPGGPLLTERTNTLRLIDSNHIEALDGDSIFDQDTFAIFDGRTRVVFEFDLGSGVAAGHVPIYYTASDTVLGTPGSTADDVAAAIRVAIEQARTQYGLDVSADLDETGDVVSLTNIGPTVRIEGFGNVEARLDARLQIDPGMIVKMDGSRIEMEMGSQLIAEGRLGSDEGAPGYKVILTSLLDERYGAGGSFNTSAITSGHTASPGDWGGLYFAPTASGSINNAIVAYGGGTTAIEGGFGNFNAVEIRQAEVRIANSRFENNAASTTGDRNGRGTSSAATIQVRGSQPVIVNNDFIDNIGAVVSIDLNSLVSETVTDWGRVTGFVADFEQYASNHGPLVRENRMTNNGINGMVVRGGVVATDSVWDDTDIVHVVFDEIIATNYHHEGVLRLQSSDTQSLVVKLSGDDAGFTAGGVPLEIDDRIGGTLQILGQPGHPVVLTSFTDDSVGAGFTLDNLPQNDTNAAGGTMLFGGLTGFPAGTVQVTGTVDAANANAGQALINSILGSGVTLVPGSIIYTGGSASAGFWTAGSDSGIVLTSGNAVNAAGPNTSDGSSGIASMTGDADLDDSFGVTTTDTTSLEFSFDFAGGDLSFDFVFASEEYNEFVEQTFNDVFGFYLESEDGSFPRQNIALVPGTNIPISIDTINGGNPYGGANASNPQYYNNNDLSDGGQFLSQLGYDGFTDVLTAQAFGLAAGRYTIKLVVSDVADSALDTGVFITANSFGNQASAPGDWRSVRIDEYSNDRNVAVVNEIEQPFGETTDANGHARLAQVLGSMAPEDKAGDDNLRLGFEVHGTIRTDDPTDADVYTFNAPAGTEIWLDIDRTTHAMDLVVELVRSDGTVLARSDNSYFEESAGLENLSTEAYTMDRDYWLRHDFYSTNDSDPGMRLVLPGPEGEMRTYYVRVRSVLAIGGILDGENYTAGELFTVADDYLSFTFEFIDHWDITTYSGPNVPVPLQTLAGPRNALEMANAIVEAVERAQVDGLEATARVLDGKVVLDGLHLRFNGLNTSLDHLANTSGEYQLQIRLDEMQEVPGSTIQYADIRFATNGIEVFGQPGHSPLLGESAEVEQGNQNSNDTVGQAQQIGNLLQVDQNAISVSGYLEGRTDVDWYAMSVDLGGVQSIPGISNLGSVWATVFDIDYADQMARPDLNLWVFDSNRNLVLAGGASSVADDQAEPIPGATIEDLSRGSVGGRDPFIGTALLAEGDGSVYYIAVTSTLATPEELDPLTNPLTRREPLNSVNRIASEHFQYNGQIYNRPNSSDPDFMGVRLDPVPYEFTLSDTILYVSIGENLYTVDPFTGAMETEVTSMLYNTRLPGAGDLLFYDDIDMRNDGTLFTVESGQTGSGFGRQEPDVLVLSTEDARNAEQRTDTGITFYERVPTAPTSLRRDANGGIQFEAVVNDYSNDRRNLYAVGTARASLGELDYTNLMYVLNPTGQAYTHPSILYGSLASGAREYSGEKVPLGRLFTAPTILAGSATQDVPSYNHAAGTGYYTDGDIEDGEWFELFDGTSTARFEFDLGREFFLDDDSGVSAIRDGQSFTVTPRGGGTTQRFIFDSGPVLLGAANFANYTTFTITGYDDPNGSVGDDTTSVVFEIHRTGTPDNPTPTPNATVIDVANLTREDVMPAIVAAINSTTSFSVTASLNDAENRISLKNDRRDAASILIGSGSGLSQSGNYTDPGSLGANTHLVDFDETDSGTQLGESIAQAVNPYVHSYGGERGVGLWRTIRHRE